MKVKAKNESSKIKQSMRKQKGITLIALIITIVILIILATISINIIFGDEGLIKRAEQAKELHEQGASKEEDTLNNVDEYLKDKIEGITEKEPTEEEQAIITVEQAKNAGIEFTTKKTLKDGVNNEVVVPAGFKIASDSSNTVQGGVVIEDVSASTDQYVQGSQFVWIPVGEFIKDDKSKVDIVLGRYYFDARNGGNPTIMQVAYNEEEPHIEEKEIMGSFTEKIVYNEGKYDYTIEDLNATAYELEKWINSARTNGGYYIGRYEASYASGAESEDNAGDYSNCKAASKISTSFVEYIVSEEQLTSHMEYKPRTLWNHIDQTDASKVAINTYSDSKSVRSDLVNSYAWDTALVFIQQASDSDYSLKTCINNTIANTGNLGNELKDEECKINDMSSNLLEFSTEYSKYTQENYALPCVCRGGSYLATSFPANARAHNTVKGGFQGFRLCLYLI